jgi:hypothetical protein
MASVRYPYFVLIRISPERFDLNTSAVSFSLRLPGVLITDGQFFPSFGAPTG